MSNNNRRVNTRATVRDKMDLSTTIVKLVMNIIVSDMQIGYGVSTEKLSTLLLNAFSPYDTILSKLLIFKTPDQLRRSKSRLTTILQTEVLPTTEYQRLVAARNQNQRLTKCERDNKRGLQRVFDTSWYKEIERRIVSYIQSAAPSVRVYGLVGGLGRQLRTKIGKQLLNKIICRSNLQEANRRAQATYNINLRRNGTDRTTQAIDILFELIDKTELVRVIFLQMGTCATVSNYRTPVNQGQQRTLQRLPRLATFMTSLV